MRTQYEVIEAARLSFHCSPAEAGFIYRQVSRAASHDVLAAIERRIQKKIAAY